MPQGPSYRTHEEMLDGLRRLEPAAFGALFAIYADLVYGFCLKLTGSESSAREIVVGAFVDAVPELKLARTEGAVERDLLRAAMRRIYSMRGVDGDEGRFQELPFEELIPDAAGGKGGSAHDWSLDPHEESRRAEEKMLLRQVVSEMPPQYGLVLVMFDMEEMTEQDAADVANLSVPRLRARLHRARLLLRRELTRRLIGTRQSAEGPAS